MEHFAWDYEQSWHKYYHIYPTTIKGDELGESFTLHIEQSPLADANVEQIVKHLNAIAESLENLKRAS